MDTIEILETLVFKIPKLRKVFIELDVINQSRNISPKDRKEFKNLLKDFNNPKIIDVIGLTEVIMIIEPIKIGKQYPVIIFEGYQCKIIKLSKSSIISYLRSSISIKDFLPDPLVRKIVYISDYEKDVNGLIFSEYQKGFWTIDKNPLSLNVDTSQKCSIYNILIEILNDIEEQN